MSKVKKQSRPKHELTILQKKLLKKFASDHTTIGELAKKVGTSYSCAYQYVLRTNLPAKMIESSVQRRNSRYVTRSGIFNVHAVENTWLI